MGKEVGDTSYRRELGTAHIYAALDKLAEQRVKTCSNLKLGQLIEKLRALKPEATIDVGPWGFCPDGWSSYRGYYSDLALNFKLDGPQVRVKDLLAQTEECLGKVFEGYKGGDYEMDADTPLWVDNYGDSHQVAITGVTHWTASDGTQYAHLVVRKLEEDE